MCIIFWSTNVEGYALVLAANRDEFLARATTSAAWHSFLPPFSPASTPSPTTSYLSGLDLQGGGTWLGISLPPQPHPQKSNLLLRFATLTNYTELLPTDSTRPSRGDLVKDFLVGELGMENYLEKVDCIKSAYAGFNLLLGELHDDTGFRMGYVSNREAEGRNGRLLQRDAKKNGNVEVVSNSTLGVKEGWPKVINGSKSFSEAVQGAKKAEGELVDKLFDVLSTANSKPITERSHLRQTVLVRPTYLNPLAPLPIPASLPAVSSTTISTNSHLTPLHLTPEDLSIPVEAIGGTWYGTRVQTIVMIERLEEGWKVSFRERDAFVLDSERGEPAWDGTERVFDFVV